MHDALAAIIRPIVEGQVRAWLHAHPEGRKAMVSGIGKRVTHDLCSEETVRRIELALAAGCSSGGAVQSDPGKPPLPDRDNAGRPTTPARSLEPRSSRDQGTGEGAMGLPPHPSPWFSDSVLRKAVNAFYASDMCGPAAGTMAEYRMQCMADALRVALETMQAEREGKE